MAASNSPAVARRRVRLALREARDTRQLTQSQVAEAMEWSLSKVMRIESGEVSISPNDLRPLLAYLGITDRTVVDILVQDARVSRRRQMWWDTPEFRDFITPAMRQMIQYEAEAPVMRHFHNVHVPGELQTPEYAQAILSSYHDELDEKRIRVRAEVRRRRREQLLARKPPPEVLVLLDESVLKRRVGGPRVFGEQLSLFSRLINEHRVTIRVLHFGASGPLPLYGAFDIYEVGGEGDAVLYRESHLSDELVEDGRVAQYRHRFELLWSASLDESTSASLVENHAKAALADATANGESGTTAGKSARMPRTARPRRSNPASPPRSDSSG